MRILLTGANGFIGSKLSNYLLERTDVTLNLTLRADKRVKICDEIHKKRTAFININDISSDTCWQKALFDCQVVIHTAARVHVMDEKVADPLAEFRKINVEGTANLARQAMKAGIRRFIYLSSIKVNGEYTYQGSAFNSEDAANPEDPYSISKHEAEEYLINLSKNCSMEIVIIRPPLVYGPGVKGNFFRMLQLAQKNMLLPLGRIKENKRSFISINNLVSLINVCITHSSAANQIFLASDGDDLSTTDLLRKIRELFGRQALLLPVPLWILEKICTLLGKKTEIMRIFGSLQIDISKTQQMLNWEPIESVDDALYNTVQDFRQKHKPDSICKLWQTRIAGLLLKN